LITAAITATTGTFSGAVSGTTGTFSGDLAVDTNVLKVDTSNNRIGVNKTSPAVSIDAGANTDAIHVPVGTTAQRPSGAAGQFRYNTTTGNFEGYTSEWGAIAGSGGGGSSSFAKDTFTGDGSTTAFTMTTSMATENGLIVFIDGVYQADNVYSVSGNTLTFATAPLNSRIIEVFQFKVSSIVGVAPVLATMTGDGSDTTLDLGTTPDSENQTFVTIDGVVQHKDTYSISGSTLTFSTAPPNTSKVEAIIFNNVNVAKETFQDADGDTKIQVEESTDEDKIRFDTGGTERMIIDNSGNVGIGNTSPSNALTIGSTSVTTSILSVVGSSSGFPQIRFSDDASESGQGRVFYDSANDAMGFSTGQSERMRIASDGDVFIGTTSHMSGGSNAGDAVAVVNGGVNREGIPFTDFDEAYVSDNRGIFEGTSGFQPSNNPGGSNWWHVISRTVATGGSATYITQTATSITGNIHTRYSSDNGSSWSSWQSV